MSTITQSMDQWRRTPQMPVSVAPYFDSQLPWSAGASENKRFLLLCLLMLALTIAFAIVIANRALPEIEREQREKLPPQLARIIEAQTPPPIPEPVLPEIVPEPPSEEALEIKPEPLEPLVEEDLPELAQPEITPEEVVLSEQEKVLQARKSAKSKGVLAFQDQLASMREQANINNLANTQLTEGAGQSELTQRNAIVSNQIATSGGIQVGELSTTVGAAGQLEGRRSTEFVAASEGQAALATKRIETQAQVVGNRSLDQIRQILDANKGAVYALYRRALRQDPSIEGKLTVKLIIAPDGSLTDVQLIDSQLNAPDLVQKLISRIALIDFGAQNVSQTELEYAFNFLPF
ncbi:AgmX/PglI C-terminal domain-containing protein [Ningiella sp. W23]|uniref:AgmX/PglI C-terminal domain-containing protein n=1 Tax=Ningiella sp. W23 TaxID=3023715 RepID=UPI00375698C1